MNEKNVGKMRYSSTAGLSTCEMIMQTGSDTFEWVIIKQNSW